MQELILDVREVPGPEAHPRIKQYLATVGMPGDDEIAWCAGFANFVLKQEGIAGTGKPNARSFLAWGDPCACRVGAIVVFWRVDPKGWQGHVGFVVGISVETIFVLGGNQKNAVTISPFQTDTVLGYRWPKGV